MSAEPIIHELPAPAGLPLLAWGTVPTALGEVQLDGRTLAKIAGSWTADCLHLLITVADPDHVPAANRNVLWSADSIEIGLDLAGDGSGALPATTTGPIGDDDAKLIVGLLADGSALNVLASRRTLDQAELLKGVHIERTGPTTSYRVDLPWSAFGMAGGAVPAIGLGVQVNDRNQGEKDKTPFHWGDGLRGGFTAAALNLHALAAPAAGHGAAVWTGTLAWSPAEKAELRVGIRSDVEVPVRLGDGGPMVRLPGGPGLRCFRILVPAVADGAVLSARVGEATPVTAVQTAAVDLYRALDNKLATLAAQPGNHPLFVRHLTSLQALVATDWARVLLQRGGDERRAVTSLGHMRTILNGLDGEAGKWESYRDGLRSMVISYVSPHDQSVQYYYLGLPRAWDAAKAYPLFFELHGAGDDHPLSGPASRLGLTAESVKLFGYDTPRVQAEIDRSGFWVHPFGRGNLGYAGIARIDVLEAYDHAHALVKIDANRRYLYGFSMGSAGTYALAMQTASRWAAAYAMSGAGMRGEVLRAGMLDNLAILPFKAMCGSEDGGLVGMQVIADAIRSRGIATELKVIPGLGHGYIKEAQVEIIDWLKAHVRTRPARFTFTVSDNLTNTCWGVRLPIGQGINLQERFGPGQKITVEDGPAPAIAQATVAISDQTVTITSTGARRVGLDFSEPDGLGLAGDVVVVWNGKEAYRGPAKALNLE